MLRKVRTGAVRPGRMCAIFLLLMPVLMATLLLPINSGLILETQVSIQNTSDSCVLAATQSMVDDRLLLDEHSIRTQILQQAADEAQDYADHNPVLGAPICLIVDYENPDDSDLVFLHKPAGTEDFVAGSVTDPAFVAAINAVRVKCRRVRSRCTQVPLIGGAFLSLQSSDVVATATATHERRINGFRPVGNQKVPMLPVAFRSSTDDSDESSWESQLESANQDEWRYDPETRTLINDGGDGLQEIEVVIDLGAGGSNVDEDELEAKLLRIGQLDVNGVLEQALTGIGVEHLTSFGGKLQIGTDGFLPIPLLMEIVGGTDLQSALQQVAARQESRIFPLFSSTDGNNAIVTGFVAARIVPGSVTVGGGECSFFIQPSVITTATALIRQEVDESRYIYRVQLFQRPE